MKKQTVLVWVAMVMTSVLAFGQSEKPVDSKITDVTVFLNKAQVTREVKTRLEPGKFNLIVTGLTSQLDTESIQVEGKGSFIILGISHRQNYLSELNMPKSLKVLRDSISFLQKQVLLEQSQKEILNKEEQMLLSNQKIGGTNENLTVAELKSMADFFRSRLSEIVTTRMKLDERIQKLNGRISRLSRQLNEQNDLLSRNTSEVVISVSAESVTLAELKLSYIVSNAGWNPIYDVRAINTKSPLKLIYMANVFQSTGEEWKNVKLRLSTANPNQSGLIPELNSWYLDFYNPIVYQKSKEKYNQPPAAMRATEDKVVVENLSVSEFVSTIQTSLNTEFDISIPYSVSSSSKPTLVDIREYEMKSEYNYAVVPKLDQDVFLIAKATGWEELSLLPGEANIFFEGTFVGNSFIDPNNIKDTLSLSLGRDQRIVVKREKLKDLTSRSVMGGSKKENYTWEISIRNTRTEAIRIYLEDQVPVSQNAQIEVSVLDTGGATYNKQTGKLNWIMDIKPSETRKVVFKFEVKYPKDKQITGLN